jgi:hypothetical protein
MIPAIKDSSLQEKNLLTTDHEFKDICKFIIVRFHSFFLRKRDWHHETGQRTGGT